MRAKIWTFAALALLALLALAPLAAQVEGETAQDEPTVTAEPAATPQVEPPADPEASQEAVEPTEPPAVEGEQAQQASPETTGQPGEAAYDSDEELPKTASPLALIALLGAGSAGSALGLRFMRRRR